MFSSAPVPMMLLDVKSQRYVEVNDAAVTLFGYSREEFLAMSAEAIRSPDELSRYKAVMRTPVPESGAARLVAVHQSEWQRGPGRRRGASVPVSGPRHGDLCHR